VVAAVEEQRLLASQQPSSGRFLSGKVSPQPLKPIEEQRLQARFLEDVSQQLPGFVVGCKGMRWFR